MANTNEITIQESGSPDVTLAFIGNAYGKGEEEWVSLWIHIGDEIAAYVHLTPDQARQLAACSLQALDEAKQISAGVTL